MTTISNRLLANYDAAELLSGSIITVVAIVLLFAYYTSNRVAGATGYEIAAILSKSDGLNVGSDVQIAGIKVGKVSGLDLRPTDYMVIVHMIVKDSVSIPVDSSIDCPGDLISGSVHLEIQPGRSKSLMNPGDVITKSQGCSADLMSTIGKALPH